MVDEMQKDEILKTENSGNDVLADVVLDPQDEVPLGGEEQENNEEGKAENIVGKNEEEKNAIPSWAFKKMSKKIKNEVDRAVTNALQTLVQIQNNQPAPITQNQQHDLSRPEAVVPRGTIQEEIANYVSRQEENMRARKDAERVAAFNSQVSNAREKFDDYDDFVNDVIPHFTQPMYALMLDVPNSVENFKLAWDEDKNKIMNINKLAPSLQIAELKRILDDVAEKKAAQKYKPISSKPISPIKSSSINITKDNDAFVSLVRNRYKKPGQ